MRRPALTVCHTDFVSAFFAKIRMRSQPNSEFLRRAIALATQNVVSGKGGPFGAVIVRGDKIIGEGANSVTSTNDPTAHGEVNAIRAAAKALGTFTLAGCELYTSCEPCPMCLAAAYWARLDAVYYGASAADAARAGFDDAFLYEELRKDNTRRKLHATQFCLATRRCPASPHGSLHPTRSDTDDAPKPSRDGAVLDPAPSPCVC
jgi:guanine deaminase